jgi:histidinol-phosphate aminotransferase
MTYFRTNIAALSGYTPGEQPQAGKFIKLNTNENPYPPSPAAIAAIAEAAGKLARYPDPLATSFRIAAGDKLGVDPDWILCGNGSDDILTILVRAFVGEGQRLRMPYPSYILYRTLADIQGAEIEQVAFNPDWSLPTAFGEASENLRLVFLPNPNSPSGTLLSPDEVLALAERLPCPLVVDEAYGEFARDNCLKLVDASDRIIVTRSMSKSYALAGLRFGYCVARPEVISKLAAVKDSYNCDTLAIAAATAAIADQRWLGDNQQKVRTTRARLAEEVKRLGFETPEGEANFVWCVHPTQPVKPLYEQLKDERILVRYMDFPGWGDGLRITVGTDEQVDALVMMLEKLLNDE